MRFPSNAPLDTQEWILWIALGLLVTAAICLTYAVLTGSERGQGIPERWTTRASYLRFVSMSCLAAMASLVACVVFIQSTSVSANQYSAIGSSIVLGLLAAVLASVYRYVVRLAYYYDSLADAADLARGDTDPRSELRVTSKRDVRRFGALVDILRPDKIEYPEATATLGKIKKTITP